MKRIRCNLTKKENGYIQVDKKLTAKQLRCHRLNLGNCSKIEIPLKASHTTYGNRGSNNHHQRQYQTPQEWTFQVGSKHLNCFLVYKLKLNGLIWVSLLTLFIVQVLSEIISE